MKWYKDVERWPRALPEFQIDKNSTALLIVDMQYYSASKEHGLAKRLKKDYPDMYEYYYTRIDNVVLPNQVKLLSYFRNNGLRVVYLRMGPLLPDGSDFYTPRRENDRLQQLKTGIVTNFYKGTFEHNILAELKPLESELIIDKTSVSAFNSTGIDNILRKMRIDSLVVVGVATNACVLTTAIDAADRWYKCIVVEDGCASFDEEAHHMALKNFARLFGMVKSTEEVINMLEG